MGTFNSPSILKPECSLKTPVFGYRWVRMKNLSSDDVSCLVWALSGVSETAKYRVM